jgi:simple sugar transport system ATP-binding protein
MQNILVAHKLTKNYGGVKALSDFDFNIQPAEIHCLVGENGSGKSTFVKIVVGATPPDGGEIIINGHTYTRLNPITAIHEGIQVIYQDLSLYPHLSVAENIAMNRLIAEGKRLVDKKEMHSIAEKQLSRIGIDIPLDSPVEELSTANRQLVAICRALSLDAKILFMDEPTTALTRVEVDRLLKIITELKEKSLSVVFISHKLNEVFEVADNITVLRDGKKVGDFKPNELTYQQLIYHMTGRQVEYPRYKRTVKDDRVLLELQNLSKEGHYNNISFKLYPGDILGIIGLLGSGRTELALSLFGLNPPTSGTILLNGKKCDINSPEEAMKHGIGLLPEDRQTKGLFSRKSVEENITTSIVDKLSRIFGVIDSAKQEKTTNQIVSSMRIVVADIKNPVQSLSGGNQQKTIIARWALTNPKIFILDSPTVGVDVGSKSEIYAQIQTFASQGISIILISDELPEILANCNKVIVMHNGLIVCELNEKDLSRPDIGEKIQLLMSNSGNSRGEQEKVLV